MSAMAGSEVAAARSRRRFTAGGTLFVVVLIALVVYLAVPMRTYLGQRERLAELETLAVAGDWAQVGAAADAVVAAAAELGAADVEPPAIDAQRIQLRRCPWLEPPVRAHRCRSTAARRKRKRPRA